MPEALISACLPLFEKYPFCKPELYILIFSCINPPPPLKIRKGYWCVTPDKLLGQVVAFYRVLLAEANSLNDEKTSAYS